jgi:regulator of sirC expression with transglutaminase-like and TPR domain
VRLAREIQGDAAYTFSTTMTAYPQDVEFTKLVRGAEQYDVIGVMLELAAEAYPDVDRASCTAQIEGFRNTCRRLVEEAGNPQDVASRLRIVSRVLYELEGFHGNTQDYYNPENSYLNRVLELRTGIPISLGILYMAVAGAVRVHLIGLNTPSHFFISTAANTPSGQLFVDAFHGGEILTSAECSKRLIQMGVSSGAPENERFTIAGPQAIVVRVLQSLKHSYARLNRWDDALRVQRRLVALLPVDRTERRDLGLVTLRAGHPGLAFNLLQAYRQHCAPDERENLDRAIQAARKLIAERN